MVSLRAGDFLAGTRWLDLGAEGGSSGTYTLSGAAQLLTQGEYGAYQFVGYGGAGTFIRSGGTNTIRGNSAELYVGDYAGGNRPSRTDRRIRTFSRSTGRTALPRAVA